MFQPVSMLHPLLLEITAKLLPHALNENFTISPTIQDEVTVFGLQPTEERQGRLEEVRGEVEPKNNGGRVEIFKKVSLKILFFEQTYNQQFLSLRISTPKSVKIGSKCCGRDRTGIQNIPVVSQSTTRNELARRGRGGVEE